MATTRRSILVRIVGAMALATSLAATSAPTVFTVTTTNVSGAGSLADTLLGLNPDVSACPAEGVRIEFAIPAATDPGCNAATGICKVQMPDDFSIRCPNTVIDGYTQAGASPNSATDLTNNAQLRIELDSSGPGDPKYIRSQGAYNGFGYNGVANITIRGLALPRHSLELGAGNTGSVAHGGSGRVIAGNWLGWHADGTRTTGIVSRGISLSGAFLSNVTVGGGTPADRNLMTYRDAALCCEYGAFGITGQGLNGALIEGNYVNVTPGGARVPFGNGIGSGILLGSNGNTPYSRNAVIRNNVIYNTAGTPMGLGMGEGMTISRNVVSGQPLGLPAWNWFTVPAGGVRNLDQPVVTGITELPGEVRVFGTVSNAANATMRLEFFHNTPGGFQGGTQAERFVGEMEITLDASGNGTFVASLPPDTRNVSVSSTNLTTGETGYLSGSDNVAQVFRLDLARAGAGLGTISVGSPSTLECTDTCTKLVAKDTAVTITATAQAGSQFVGWSGACSGVAPCTLTMSQDRSVTANYIGGSGPPVIGNAPLTADVASGVPFSYTYSVTGLVPFAWTLEPNCTLPGGLSLSSSGTISGTPSTGSERIECFVRVTNGVQPDAVQPYELRANVTAGTPLFTASTLPSGTTGAAYAQPVPVQGAAPLTLQVIAGTTPPGLTLAGAGFSGTPTADGTYIFMLKASGPEGTATRRFTMTVGLGVAPLVTSSAPPNGSEFTTYTHTFAATGTAPIAWSVVSGSLPPGLALDAATGVLSGTPTLNGAFNFTVQAVNGTPPATTQVVAMTITLNSRTLTINRNGTGTGTVVSTPAGIDCGSACSAHFAIGSGVSLLATPDADSTFASWTNCPSASGSTCAVSMSAGRTVTASFAKKKVALTANVVGGGQVMSSPSGIACHSGCSTETASFDLGSAVTLTATPIGPMRFAGWTGACSGSGTTCLVTMDAAKSVTATFVQQFLLSVASFGSPATGKVTGTPAGIDCPGVCSVFYDPGTVVQLVATPDPGAAFVGWGNACSGTGTCTVTLNGHVSVTATYAQVAATQALTLDVEGDLHGAIQVGSDPSVCNTLCSLQKPTGSTVTLTALPNDYYAFASWGGACSGTQAMCTVTMNGPRTAVANYVPKMVALTVSRTGNGTGTVSSPDLNCGATCQATVAAKFQYTLTATPAAGSSFAGWTGACANTASTTCVLDLKQATTVTARFTKAVTLTVAVQGRASVTSSPAGLRCSSVSGTTCTGTYDPGTVVTLSIHPQTLQPTWAGCSATAGPVCTITLNQDSTVQVSPGVQHRPVQIRKIHGLGAVSVASAGGAEFARCEADAQTCQHGFLANDTLVFSAEPASGHAFMGWLVANERGRGYVSVDCSSESAQCVLPMSDPRVQSLFDEAGEVLLYANFVRLPSSIAGVATSTAPALSRSTRVGTPFLPAPAILLRDFRGDPVPGARVTFTSIPASNGAVGTTGSRNASGPILAVETRSGADGVASLREVANGIVGPWTLRVTVEPGNLAPLDIAMNNTNEPVPVTVPGNGTATIPTSSTVGVVLTVVVRNALGTPVNGAAVRFSAPASPNTLGFAVPSGTLTPASTNTNSAGVARTTLRSNGVSGTFSVTVRVTLPPSIFGGSAAGGFEGDDYVTEITAQTADVPDAVVTDPQGDYDNDGIPNAVENAEGTLPFDKDNDLFADARLFAMQQYRDFLGREGDAGGVTHWTNQLSSGAQTRAQMAETYFNSAEFQGLAAPVARLYFAYFLRIPDYSGLNFWIGQYRGGSALEAISNAFAGSPEFVNTYGALDNAGFVDRVYRNVLGRAPDATGLAHWKGQLDGGMTRGRMMVAFSESAEYRGLITNEIYVTMMYAGMLRRAPDASGFSFWVGYLDAGNSGLALTQGFLDAVEYRARFLP